MFRDIRALALGFFTVACVSAEAVPPPDPSGAETGLGADDAPPPPAEPPAPAQAPPKPAADAGAAPVLQLPCGGCAAGLVCSQVGVCIPEGECNADVDCEDEERCEPKPVPSGSSTGYCVPRACEEFDFQVESLPSDVFITLDRSCSLTQVQWEGAVSAVTTLLESFRGRMRWGLGLFPDKEGAACVQERPTFAVGDDQEDAIAGLLAASVAPGTTLHPGSPCVTNIDTAMLQASQDPAILDPSRPGAVIVITDGAQYACNAAGGNAGTLGIISGLATAGTPTFVVGFGSGVDRNALNEFAVAGGHPRTDPEYRYHQVEDALSLQTALEEIAGQLVSCVFPLGRAPKNGERVSVVLDAVRLGMDEPDGFTFDTASLDVTLTGAACTRLREDPALPVEVEFSCIPDPPPGVR